MLQKIVIFLLISQNWAKSLNSISLKIDVLSLKPCNTNKYPVQVSDVSVKIDNGNLIISGKLSTNVALVSPVEAIVNVKKYELGIWIKVPCVNQMGSCIYKDLCIHSIPANSSCPRQFINNNIPCRCPIPKGNYTIPTVQLQMDYWSLSSIYTGKYWARVISANKGDNLACYEVYFNIYDNNMSNLGSVPYFDDNALDPIVELVD